MTFLGMIFETGGHMFVAMHLAISYYTREIMMHEVIEIRVLRVSVDLKEVSIIIVFIK